MRLCRESAATVQVTASRVLRGVARVVRRGVERIAHPFRLRAAVRLLSRRRTPRFVLVVCHGNICRSPYAAELLRLGLQPLAGHHLRVASAGFVGPGRPCPAAALEVAASRGLDLSHHRSRLLAAPDVFAAELILVMDANQRWAVRTLFGRSGDDVLVLGDLDPEPIEAREIRDPFDQPREVFERSYSRIERCVRELVRAASLRAQDAPARGVADGGRGTHQEQTA